MSRTKSQKKFHAYVSDETMEENILLIRGQRVILDRALAKIYGVTTKRLNEQVKRNSHRFPGDFCFRMTREEFNLSQMASNANANLRSQNATSNSHGGHRYLPFAFTEHGAIMAANVLSSRRAVDMSVYVVRAFIRLREVFVANQVLEERLSEIEKMLLEHNTALFDIYKKIKPLLLQPKRADAIGFQLTGPRIGKIN